MIPEGREDRGLGPEGHRGFVDAHINVGIEALKLIRGTANP
jgi:hypothetical protein